MARHDAHAGAAAHAAPQPATRREVQPRARVRVARRLRRLGGLLAQPEPPRGDRRYYSAQAAPGAVMARGAWAMSGDMLPRVSVRSNVTNYNSTTVNNCGNVVLM